MSYSYDLQTWNWFARVDSEENYCVLVEEDGYVLIDSPYNGVGVRMSSDLIHWHEVGRYLLTFHGATPYGRATTGWHGEASLGIAWSDDLRRWFWPSTEARR